MKKILLTLVVLMLAASGALAQVTNVTQGLSYGTIGAAMAAAVAGDDITVAAATYPENVVVSVGVTLRSLAGAVVTTIAGAGGATVTINADNVEIDGFTITNPTGTQAIYSNDHSGLLIHNNIITNVGDGVTAVGVQSIAIVCTAVDVNNVVIENNDFSNILGGPNKSMSAMSIGWSTGSFMINGLIIQNNTITNLTANTSNWPVGHGAYGILINHGTGSTGKTVAPQILNNNISNLTGFWAHAIGLEGNTPNAVVSGNIIDNIVDTKSTLTGIPDAVAILVEDNLSLGSVAINGNAFTNVLVGVGNAVTTLGSVNAAGNYWGALSGPYQPTTNLSGTGVAASDLVDYSPWFGLALGSAPMTIGTNDVIQDAINLANSGDTVNVLAGHFEEQLHITAGNLAIVGAGQGATFVDSPVALTDFYTTSNDNYPVVFVDNAEGVAFSDLTVDGLGRGNGNYRFQGFGYYNSGGSLTNVHVANIMDTPFSGAQHGNGVYCVADDMGPHAFAMTDCLVDGFQKTGVVVAGEGITGTLLRVTTPGQGATSVTAQNGIQVSSGADATVTDCDVSGIDYTGATWTATGLLVFGPSVVNFDGCTVDNSQTSVYFVNGGGSFDNSAVTNPVGDALYAYSDGAKSLPGSKRLPQGFDAEPVNTFDKLAINVSVNNSVFTGTGLLDSWGVAPYGSGPITFTMNNSTVTNFDWGVAFYDYGGAVINSTLRGNTLSGNTTYGAFANTTNYQDCLFNDWGDPTGPLHSTLNPAGLGNAVSDMILFTPWSGGAGITIAPSTAGPFMCGLNAPVTFTYTSDVGAPDLFLYNIIVRTSGEVVFQPTSTGGISSEDPFGGAAASEQFLAYDNGDDSWTISGSTVASSGNVLPGGSTTDLFTVNFLTDSDGTAAITIDSITLRDPSNATFYAGVTSAAITVDCIAPAAVTGITASPRHNKVDVAWTHNGVDVDHYEVFSGVWHDGANNSAYPEYDDLAGITAPTPPASPTVAIASAEWNAVAPNPVVTNTTESWSDQLSRGVYYYTVFAVDAAGNVSAAPAALDRATNYWLGDVAGTDGTVGVLDITALGTNFGDTVPPGASFNVLDVGPTFDFSRLGIPTTDSVINFEDLMMFSLNFGVVSSAKDKPPVTTTADLAWVTYDDGSQALRLVNGSSLKGLRVTANVPVGSVEAGQLLDDQSELTFLKNVGSNLDANVAVMGLNQAFEGSGDLFIVRSGSGIKVEDLHITARGTDNSELKFSMNEASGTLTPRVFSLNANYPNPFNPMTKISFSLPEAQDVQLAVYSIDGRKVATLINETRGPGLHEIVWTGRDDQGQTVSSGLYFYRLDAGPYSQVRKMTLMK